MQTPVMITQWFVLYELCGLLITFQININIIITGKGWMGKNGLDTFCWYTFIGTKDPSENWHPGHAQG